MLVNPEHIQQLIDGTISGPPAIEPDNTKGPTRGEYSTEFLDLVNQAIAHFNISDDNQPSKKLLVEWFLSQKIDSQEVSNNLASQLATASRMAKERRGGNKRL